MARHVDLDENTMEYVGTVDGLPDVVVFGKTPATTLIELETVIDDLRELSEKMGHDFPDIRKTNTKPFRR